MISIPTETCRRYTTSGAHVVRWEKNTRPFLAFQRVFVAGRPYGIMQLHEEAEEANDPDAECICGFLLSRCWRFR